MQNNRGKIINRERARQQIDFSGLRFGNITPTDIDYPPIAGAIEYKNKAYIFMEFKYENAKMAFGQRLFHERHTDDLEYRKPTITIIASHNTHDCNENIDAANASVREYRYKRKWTLISARLKITVRKMIELFLGNLGIGSEDFRCLCVAAANNEDTEEKTAWD